ncbi:MAG: hypothetical protein ACOY8P_05460 [Thermodesulfobacteriota bacterium]
MKKVLVTVAALGLVAGVATTASAVEWKMSGKYVVEGFHLSDGTTATNADGGMDLTEAAGEDNMADSWYQHTFEISPTMKVNDKISMFATIRMADNTVWGSNDAATEDTVGSMSSNNDVYFHHLYMDYASPIGKIRLGRTPAGGYGTTFADTDTRQNRIMLWPSFMPKPWSALLYIAKADEDDKGTAGSALDSDHYEARLGYTVDNLEAGIAYSMTNNNTGATEDEKELYKGYAKYKMDNYFVNAEIGYYTGDQTSTVDWEALGGMLEVGGKFNNLTVSAMYFYAEGDDDTTTGDNEGFMNATGTSAGTGAEFEPLYILTGRTTGLLNPDQGTINGNMQDDGVHAFILAADYKVSDALSLHGAIGYAQADEETATYDDEYGWEYNIGAAYKLLDNLTYEAHFGYLDTGDYFNAGSTTDTTENVYMLSHHLTMTF